MSSAVRVALVALPLLSCGPGGTVAVHVQVVIPPTVPTIASGELYLSLYVYDPGIADVGATLADRARAAFAHAGGHRDVIAMRVMGHVPGAWRHYITVEGCEATPEGLMGVLWDGIEGVATPRVVEMRYRTTPVSCQAAG